MELNNVQSVERIDQVTLAPIFQLLDGSWHGTKKTFDANGLLVNERVLKSSYLLHKLTLNEKMYDYYRIDEYLKDDVADERREYAGYFSNKRIWFSQIDNDHTKFDEKPINIDGWFGQIIKDPYQRTLISYWEMVDQPDVRAYSFTILNEDSNTLNTIVLWYKNGLVFKRTNIDQVKINV